jgi:hypothetical protein
MAQFNPAPLLRNPKFRTTFTIRRRVMVVDNHGRAVPSVTDIPNVVGAIVPSGSLGMVRTPEVERQGDNITIYCEEPLQTGSGDTGAVADEILWHGMTWQVTAQDDWSDFGFNVAQAQLAEPGGRAYAT